jgi:hypothetical protein
MRFLVRFLKQLGTISKIYVPIDPTYGYIHEIRF